MRFVCSYACAFVGSLLFFFLVCISFSLLILMVKLSLELSKYIVTFCGCLCIW